MSLKNIMNLNALNMENFDAHNQLRIVENSNVITHQISETTGEYTISDKNSNVILSTDTNGNLTNASKIKQHVLDNVAPINRTLTTHTTTIINHEARLAVVEQASGVGSLGIDDILTNSNDASGKSVIGLNGVTCQTLTCSGNIASVNITSMGTTLTTHTTALNNIGTYTNIAGTTTNTTIVTVETIPITTGKIGLIHGYIISSGCYINFSVHVKNNGTLSILSFNLDYDNSLNNETVVFTVSGLNLLVRFSNATGTNNYSLKYTTDFVNII